MAALTINLNSIANLSRSQFRQIAIDNPDMKLERNKQGNLIVMAPTGGETGNFNFDMIGQLYLWNPSSKAGKAFDSSTYCQDLYSILSSYGFSLVDDRNQEKQPS
jgi:Uma2 family endonuclease